MMYLGIEIGGTKLQLGVGTGGGREFVALERCDVDRSAGAEGILRQMADVGSRLAAEHHVTAAGIGFGGPVDARTGRVLKSHQVAGWENLPLVDWCRDALGVPAVLGNDCDLAALAEARFGAGRRRHTVFFVTVGTGIGGGLVIGGRLHGNGRPAVAEIGHLRPGPDAVLPTQTVESLAAGPAIAAAARRHLADPLADADARNDLWQRCGGDVRRLTAQDVAAAAADGNAIARSTLLAALNALGWAVAQAITITAADVVVVGGGVSLHGEEGFFVPLRAAVARYVFPPLAASFEIVPAALAEAVVVHGALALAADAATER